MNQVDIELKADITLTEGGKWLKVLITPEELVEIFNHYRLHDYPVACVKFSLATQEDGIIPLTFDCILAVKAPSLAWGIE